MTNNAFDSYEGQVRRFVVVHVLTMGLGNIRQAAQREAAGPVPGCNGVKQMLLRDEHLLREIADEVRMVFDAAVASDRVRADDAAPWLRVTTQYVTWRLAGRRARELFREPLGVDDSAELASARADDRDDAEGSNDPETNMLAAEARAELARRLDAFFAVLPGLSEADQALIRGRLEGECYDVIAERLGTQESVLRLRMHRLQKRLRPLITAHLGEEE